MIFYTQFTIRFSEITVIFKNKPPAIGNFSDCGYFLFLRRAEKAFHTAEKYFVFKQVGLIKRQSYRIFPHL